jgi:hypothetical protein
MNYTSATTARLRRHFRYYPKYGLLAWNTSSADAFDTYHRAGNEAVMMSPSARVPFVLLDGQAYPAESICWAVYADEWLDIECVDPMIGLVLTNFRLLGPASVAPPAAHEPPPEPGYVVGCVDWGSEENFWRYENMVRRAASKRAKNPLGTPEGWP